MKNILKINLLAVLIISAAVNAYVIDTYTWASNKIVFYTGFNTNEDGTSAADYQSALNNAMTSWNNNSNFQYTSVLTYKDPCDISNSDINSTRFKNDICGTAFGATVLAVAGGSHYSGTTNSARAYIIFNSLNSWGIHDNNSDSPIDFKRVALHEVGHTLGLDHEEDNSSIMNPSYQGNITTLQPDDINGIRAIYGLTDDHGNNTSNATAISFNINVSGSIEIGGDDDYFRITVPAGGGYLDIYSTGFTDTYGYLLNSLGSVIAENDNSGVGDNFRFKDTTVAGTYDIIVRGYNSNVTGNYTIRADFTTIPNTPSTPSASDGTYTDKVRISWSSVSGANSYTIYRCTSTSSSSCSQISTDSSSPYDDTSATIGTTYYYQLKACSNSGGNGCSDYSNYDTGYRAIVVPNTPTVSDGDYTDKVRISWSSVSGANSYIVYRCTSTSSSSCSQISTDSSSPYDDTSATIGTTYYYRLKACSGSSGTGICSDYSNYDTGYRAIVVPNTPAASDGDYTDKVRISWSSVSGANSYIIYRCTGKNSSCSQIDTDSSLPYDDASATAGIIYYYQLKACSGSGGSGNCSDYSNYDTGYRAIVAPNTPAASDGDYTDKVRISWSSVSGANSYIIYRCTSINSNSCSQIDIDSTSSYDDIGVTAGIIYYYRLIACSGSSGSGNCSDYSNYDSGYRAIVAPNTPTVSDGDYTDKVRISWSSVSGANSYIIYRCTSTSSSSCSQIGTDSTSSYDDTEAAAGIIYYYQLTACSGSSGSGNCSSYSSYNQGHRAISTIPSIAFSPATITAFVRATIDNITVINIGGVVASYSIAPAITNNLSFSTTTGTISGTPSATASATTYTVTAANSKGSDSATISIVVKSFSLDVDGNGSLASSNDGLIIFKYLLNPNANNLHTDIANNAIEGRKNNRTVEGLFR